MKIIYSTGKSMMLLAYLQKILASILALAFSIFYIVPALQSSTNLDINTIFVLVFFCILIFELILHFGLSSFVQGLINKELRIIDLIGAGLTFIIILWISLHSTQTNPLLTKKNKNYFVNIDSLHRVHGEILALANKENSRRVNEFEAQSNSGLQKLQDNTWAYLTAVKSYENNKAYLLSEIKQNISKLENNYNLALKRAEAKNKELKKSILENSAVENNKSTWLGLAVLIFSIYSTIVVGAYKVQSKEVQNTEVQTKKRKKNTNINIVVQNQVQSNNVENTNIVLTELAPQEEEKIIELVEVATELPAEEQPKKLKVSNARTLATQFMKSNEFLSIPKDKDRFELVQKEFGISWGTYSDIKRKLKESN